MRCLTKTVVLAAASSAIIHARVIQVRLHDSKTIEKAREELVDVIETIPKWDFEKTK
jgi:uncharacterized protein (UPF0264 family)